MRANTTIIALLAAAAAAPMAFNNGAGWKRDADGKLETDANGNPIYVDASGREMVTEAGTIARLNGEAQQHRTAKEKAEAALKVFTDAGLTDPAAAKAAIEKLSQIDQSKLIESGELERVKAEISSTYQSQLDAAKKANDELNGTLNSLRLDNAFGKSEFIRDRVAVPPEMFVATFGKHFKVGEDGKIAAYGADGNPLYSKNRVGEPATVDEAFEMLTDTYAHKDTILKAHTPQGGGGGGGGGGRGGARHMTRAQFDALAPHQKAEAAKQQNSGELTIS